MTNQVNEPPPLVMINNKEKWKVEDIFNAKSYWSKLQYWVKWVGWDEIREWYDIAGFENFPKIVKDFYSCYSGKPRSGKLAVWKSRMKKNRELGIFFYYLLERPCVLIKG